MSAGEGPHVLVVLRLFTKVLLEVATTGTLVEEESTFVCQTTQSTTSTRTGISQGHIFYGTEYEIGFNPFKHNLHDHDAPCAVCYVKSRATQLMIPARNDCPSGWTEEYHGYPDVRALFPQEISQFHLH
ncbi:hypothetical protein OS493_004840 [Desmophyllum pertusum]|uniref:S-protein homolog n=1 Tax=Desmophyllum pertusum TaxID=174260 RepID=A0A9X0CSK6_9CNID|nr:hypothetical protein OS493_004840 [Desmophyllum pertusum]